MADRDAGGRFVAGHVGMGGRPPRATEAAMLEDIFAWFGTPEHRQELFEAWQRECKRGNAKAIELALAYVAGKPRTDVNLMGAGGGMDITVRYVDAGEVQPADTADAPAAAADTGDE